MGIDLTVVIVNTVAFLSLAVAFLKDGDKSKKALAVAATSFLRILPSVVATIIFIGLIMGFVPREVISAVVGEQNGFGGIVIVALLGSILHIPSLISFPLAAAMLRSGASVTSVSVFITTLTMIGIVTLPVEIEELGRKFALLRNLLSFVIAVIIGLMMGMIL